MLDWLFKKNNNFSCDSLFSGKLTINSHGIVFDIGIHIDGKVNLDITSNTTSSVIRISKSGEVNGNLKADNILVNGVVKGDITAKGMVEVAANGKVTGNVHCNTFEGNRNAVFLGKIIERKK